MKIEYIIKYDWENIRTVFQLIEVKQIVEDAQRHVARRADIADSLQQVGIKSVWKEGKKETYEM